MPPGIGVGIHLNKAQLEQAKKEITDKLRRGLDLSKPYARFETYFHRVTIEGFAKGGRDKPWAPLSDFTLALRKARGKRVNPRRILQDRGILKGSFAAKISKTRMKFGTSVPYAAIHQFGGTSVLNLPAVTIFPKHGNALKFVSRSGDTVFAKSVHLPARQQKVLIPARPFLIYNKKDEMVLVGYMKTHMEVK